MVVGILTNCLLEAGPQACPHFFSLNSPQKNTNPKGAVLGRGPGSVDLVQCRSTKGVQAEAREGVNRGGRITMCRLCWKTVSFRGKGAGTGRTHG